MNQMQTDVFGGPVHSTTRPDVQLSRGQLCAYIPPKLEWEFWKSDKKEKIVFPPKPQQVAYNEQRHLSQAAGGLHISVFLTLHIETAYTTHEVTSLNQGHSFPQQQVS